jgi:hypothetical protein
MLWQVVDCPDGYFNYALFDCIDQYPYNTFLRWLSPHSQVLIWLNTKQNSVTTLQKQVSPCLVYFLKNWVVRNEAAGNARNKAVTAYKHESMKKESIKNFVPYACYLCGRTL